MLDNNDRLYIAACTIIRSSVPASVITPNPFWTITNPRVTDFQEFPEWLINQIEIVLDQLPTFVSGQDSITLAGTCTIVRGGVLEGSGVQLSYSVRELRSTPRHKLIRYAQTQIASFGDRTTPLVKTVYR